MAISSLKYAWLVFDTRYFLRLLKKMEIPTPGTGLAFEEGKSLCHSGCRFHEIYYTHKQPTVLVTQIRSSYFFWSSEWGLISGHIRLKFFWFEMLSNTFMLTSIVDGLHLRGITQGEMFLLSEDYC
ncbi:hypothetical protein ACH5RR_011156 [Cinchona calisaya]|uniref:Uncharacterized protein n=1 Tax=Cinchona calisaya TaxID=153742 RepID=A0ABD3A7L7_9GENT